MFSFGSSNTGIKGDILKHSGFIVDVSAGNVMLGCTTEIFLAQWIYC